MAHWIIEDRGFGGQYFKCSHCGEVYNDLYDDVSSEDECPCCHELMDEEKRYVWTEKTESNPSKNTDLKLKDLLGKFLLAYHLRIRIDGVYICDTISDGPITDLYRDYSVDLLEPKYEMRDDAVHVYLEVWLSKEE